MKIAVPADGSNLEKAVSLSFGRAPYYLIHDNTTKQSEVLDNEAATSQGGTGIQAAQFLVDQGVKAAIVPRCGKNAAEVLRAAGIELYQCQPGSVQHNLDALAGGELSLLEAIHPGLHRHGGR
ncbi:NifB/NifX family molybdenum-iron cluster-binding protein [Anoxynatronum buryatiense]|uniref:Predicted Fe-Mo cluster-binding protein, NifX family n=1 Tax=Anoxynatronum buryatiense TaxID=489973 RepID=A0AA45WTS0_9CLOT|nr:NifB/NifX family molybdenum-iron cluster-binding protein [Anoxynatronum buryatiense]SMP43312.1 Predicted Fe-Mo cluster-binding protein, NifX family [Anoxynatronum buryatiense]